MPSFRSVAALLLLPCAPVLALGDPFAPGWRGVRAAEPGEPWIPGAVALGDRWDGTGELLYLFGGVTAIGAAVAFAAVRFPSLAPALKMGIAYPLANRFRTGMAIAMFSLIVFSLSTFGAINASFVSLLTADGGDGGWDVMTTANRNTASTDLVAALRGAGAPVADDIASIGYVTTFTGQSRARVPGGDDFRPFPVLAADHGFLGLEDASI